MRAKKFLAMAIALGLAVGATAMPTLAADKKTFVFGDTTFNAENEEADINPQNTYAGWACIRYGVGETLFRYSDTMEIEPWIILYGTAIPESGRRAERSNGKSGICRRIYRTGFEITEHRNRSYVRYVDKRYNCNRWIAIHFSFSSRDYDNEEKTKRNFIRNELISC